ncbi:SDR family oxidoreductase [Nocardioides sp. YIM 152315]|uniref:SDR family NAD(P)-dependent oxidoreductase n=1 Tax=Nocardioides sp. YIM 152315 TaxID=3031760 RepID=UPI0023DC6809|nr:SDR family oxidoreductase [Nocardioides sp. YIM 152315]MDF1605284.1 SDR family oxidoreductase [Nocardioides sp. YIM 152315]
MTTRDLDGRRALVTGGAGDIGRSVVERLVARGAEVTVLDRAAPADLRVDLADARAVEAIADVVRTDAFDILVQCAAVVRLGRLVESGPDDWDLMYAVNQRAPMVLTQAALPGMVERGWGRVVLIGSDSARAGAGGESAYAATKAALLGFARSAAREVARAGVTVNVVCPGPIDTAMTRAAMADRPQTLERLVRAIPVGRLGAADEVAAAVDWLVAPSAGFVTGQAVSVSGGMTMQ